MLQLSQDPRLYERLVASLAPNIFGMEDVKKGLLCQLFGGCGKSFPGGRVRGEINCLLVRADHNTHTHTHTRCMRRAHKRSRRCRLTQRTKSLWPRKEVDQTVYVCVCP